MTAKEIVANIGTGWNLGNTFDARGNETAWVKHVTTKANIQAISEAGFDAIRIPVTWTVGAGANVYNYWTIHEAWLRRIEEVVQWAYDLGMTVIINTHHEDTIHNQLTSNPEMSHYIFTRIWSQIASYFNHQFGNRLLFEGHNEPRIIGEPNEWTGGTPEQHRMINRHYQSFVDIVRASGGNNKTRSLLITPHGASATKIALNGLELPKDPTLDRLILSVHTYSPFDFTFKESPLSQFNPGATKENPGPYGDDWSHHSTPERILHYFDNIQTRADELGIPVILGEWGSQDKDNTKYRAAHAKYYVAEAKRRGWATFWWDNNKASGAGELFAIFNRESNTWHFPEIVDAIMEGAKSGRKSETAT